ncbi:MAG: UDP-N-acetylglucosamine 4,6-dehydratase (inverting) [Deltaproteobacteria bacterium CG11_big_fil_rev_8_21_14_0_20_45_16]|nr:MAG: UDP-N-acetylglucosamine 4,6-dehydratase (inverting) [Deltaproteobacteria bacterium CG11_big_fil_rev_8_21_14_0_20_45_16]
MDMSSKKILITGGTGSFGKAFTRYALENLKPNVIRIFSRDELKQAEMRQEFGDHPCLRFFVGDVRDADRVERALRGVDIVIHAAAMKRIEVCEYNPFEAVKTNIIGTQNVIDKAIDCGVERLISLSTDKAANPVNLYGATKLCQEKIVVQSNSYVGPRKTRLSCVRYGNVVGSRGSVVQLFQKQIENGELQITDDRMTRFWITIPQAIRFVETSLAMMQGGEIFVPKLPSMRITELTKALYPKAKIKMIGIRPGEKLHEMMITEDESRHTIELEDRFVINPEFSWWSSEFHQLGKIVPKDFIYSSDRNEDWLTGDRLLAMVKESC